MPFKTSRGPPCSECIVYPTAGFYTPPKTKHREMMVSDRHLLFLGSISQVPCSSFFFWGGVYFFSSELDLFIMSEDYFLDVFVEGSAASESIWVQWVSY